MSSSATPTPTTTFRDTATDCALCLSPLTHEPCLTLTCGHIYHTSCLQNQLHHAQPNPSRRLLFSGCYCAKCAHPCEHPSLTATTAALTVLREKVDVQLLQQAAVDNLKAPPSRPNLLEYARTVYAFYLCSICREPYFGGTALCADDPDEHTPPSDRTCPSCTPRAAAVCRHDAHAAHRVWKCRYCCSPATHVCYGSTHFCDACHERNTRRHHRIVACRTRSSTLPLPAPLAPVPCPGPPTCALLTPGDDPHCNGPELHCERVLSCAACDTDASPGAALNRTERGSPNMVFNPFADHGLRGWAGPSNRWHSQWAIEQSEHSFGVHQQNFVSSYMWCSMAQAVRLTTFVRDPANVFLEISARHMARWDCPSVFRLGAVLTDEHGNELRKFETGEIDSPPDYWDKVRFVFEPTEGARWVIIAVHGTDTKSWAGHYGSKVTGCVVRALYDDSVVDESAIVLPHAFENPNEERAPDAALVLRKFWSRNERRRDHY